MARVPRSRLAFALAVTVAALPILVLDNLPASAEKADEVEQVTSASAHEDAAPPTTAPPVTIAAAPTTTAAPPAAEAAVVPPRPATTTTVAPARKVATLRTTPTTQAPPPPPTTTPPPPPAATTANGDPNDPASWDRMAQCEAGGNWAANTGNGYFGGLQFSLSTWRSYGGTGYPHEASKATQIAIGKKLQAAKGWSAWPGCARKLGFT
jgi:hypothetical protein